MDEAHLKEKVATRAEHKLLMKESMSSQSEPARARYHTRELERRAAMRGRRWLNNQRVRHKRPPGHIAEKAELLRELHHEG